MYKTILRSSIVRFILFLSRRFDEDRCLQHASALAYTTLLSLVPLMAVSISILTAFPVFENVSDTVQNFVIRNLVPASSDILQDYLRQFAAKASQLTAAGIGGLIVTSLMMMAAIDKALNTIWRSRIKRSVIKGFMVYWSLLTMGPIMLGVSVAVSSYLFSLPVFSDFAASEFHLLKMMPLMLSIIAFSLMYMIVPNRHVPASHALLGGILAALLFELAKKGFAFYVTNFPTYEAIYGTLATLPIFLMWIYVSWLVTLLGAEFTHSLSAFRADNSHYDCSSVDKLRPAFRILAHLWKAQQQGESLSIMEMLKKEPELMGEELDIILNKLSAIRFVHRTDSREWALSRDLSNITLLDLYRAQAFILPNSEEFYQMNDAWDSTLKMLVDNINYSVEHNMHTSLAELFEGKKHLAVISEVPKSSKTVPFARTPA